MDVAEIEERVEAIRGLTRDPEVAHIKEDELHQDVLAAIAGSKCGKPRVCAMAALKTREISFARWCA